MTKQDCIKKALEYTGWKQDLTAKTKKFVVMVLDGKHVYLGSNGACRKGDTLKSSIPVAPSLVQDLINRGAELIRAAKSP